MLNHVKVSTPKGKGHFAGILPRNVILIPTGRKRLIHLLLPLHGPRLLPWLLIIRHGHVTDDRTLLASIPFLPAQLLHYVMRVAVLSRRLTRPRHAVEIGSLGAFVESGFVDLRYVDFNFDWSWHISFGFGLLKLPALNTKQLEPFGLNKPYLDSPVWSLDPDESRALPLAHGSVINTAR